MRLRSRSKYEVKIKEFEVKIEEYVWSLDRGVSTCMWSRLMSEYEVKIEEWL